MQPDTAQSAKSYISAQEAVTDRLQQVAAAAAVVDPETAADIAADASPQFPETAKAARSRANFEPAFSGSQTTALPEQGELLLGSSAAAGLPADDALTASDRESSGRYDEQNQGVYEQSNQAAFSSAGAELVEPPLTSQDVVLPTGSVGPKANKGNTDPSGDTYPVHSTMDNTNLQPCCMQHVCLILYVATSLSKTGAVCMFHPGASECTTKHMHGSS